MLARTRGLVVGLLAIIVAIAVLNPEVSAEDYTFKFYRDTDAPGYDYQGFTPPTLASSPLRCNHDMTCNTCASTCRPAAGDSLPAKNHVSMIMCLLPEAVSYTHLTLPTILLV